MSNSNDKKKTVIKTILFAAATFFLFYLISQGAAYLIKQIAPDEFIDDNKYFYNETDNFSDAYINIDKSERTCELVADSQTIGCFEIALSQNPEGRKTLLNDNKTPEGEYYICDINTNSKYNISFIISYPNINDAKWGQNNEKITEQEYLEIENAIMNGAIPPFNTALGGEIEINGGGIENNRTDGSIALTKEDIYILEKYIEIGTKIIIKP